MKRIASDSISDASGWLLSETRRRRVGLLLLSAVLLVTIFAGCGGGRVPTEPTINPGPTATQTPPPFFPKHDFPPGTDYGGHYFAGKLILEEGCLLVEVPYNPNDAPWSTRLVVWPSSFSLEEDSGTVRVLDGQGRMVAQVGDHLRLSWAEVKYDEDIRQELSNILPEQCPEGHILAGGDITAFNPRKEATEFRLSDPEVLFIRQKTVMSAEMIFLTASGYGDLVLEGPCLRIRNDQHPGTVSNVVWPPGFSPHVEDGVVEVRNGAGQVITKVGDEIVGGGGYRKSKHKECPGEAFHIHSIRVLPDVPVYFPKWYEGIKKGQVEFSHKGELALDGKCLGVKTDGPDVFEIALLFWPEAYELNVEDGVVEVLDKAGRALARVGDVVQVNAFRVAYDQARKYTGLNEIRTVCGGPYWVVEEITTANKTP